MFALPSQGYLQFEAVKRYYNTTTVFLPASCIPNSLPFDDEEEEKEKNKKNKKKGPKNQEFYHGQPDQLVLACTQNHLLNGGP